MAGAVCVLCCVGGGRTPQGSELPVVCCVRESAAPRADAAQLPPDAAPASSLGGSGTLGAVPNKYCCYTQLSQQTWHTVHSLMILGLILHS